MDILIIRRSGGLGDIICCEPVIRGIRKKYPHAEITFGTPREFSCLFEGRSEATYKGYGSAKFTPLWLRKYVEQYDIFLDLCGPEATDEKYGSPDCSRTESFCSYAGVESSCPEIHLAEHEKNTAMEELQSHPKPWIGIGPNGKNWTKNWPPERWGELIEKLPGTAFYFDSKNEPKFQGAISIVGRPLREVAALVSQLDMMVAVDTGLLHLAGATGVKSYSIWGPTDPKRTLKHYHNAYYLDPAPYREKAGCRKPCMCVLTQCLNESLYFSKCMESIPTKAVVDDVLRILDDKKEDSPVPMAVSYEPEKKSLPKKSEKPRVVWAGKHLLPMIGGAERTAVELLRHIAGEGYDVMAFWSHHTGGPFEHYSEEIQGDILWAQTPPGALASKMLEADPDIILTQLSAAPHIAKAVPKTIPLILFLHSVQEHFCRLINSHTCHNGSPIDLLECEGCDDESFAAMQDVYRAADEVIANSDIMAKIFKKFTGRDAIVQYPVVDRERCGNDKPAKRYCVAIGVTENRGQSFLGQLARAMPKQKFVWVGAAGSTLPNVKIVSWDEDIAGILSGAFLNLTPHESFQAFGRTPVEAGWAGVPTLTFDNGGLPEAVGDGGMVLSKSVGAWRDAIRSLRKNKREWERLSRAARKHAESFNWDAIDEILETYKKIVPAKPIVDTAVSEPVLKPRVLDEPLVSVVIPTYNRADLLPKTIDSVLAQSYQNIEIVVADDASTDDTEKVCREYGDKIVYVKREENGNTANALNTGIKASKGDFVCWLSDDDYFEDEDKTKIQLEMFEKDADLRLVHSNFYIDWGDGRKTLKEVPQFLSQKQAFDFHVGGECLINGSTVMFDRRIFKEIGMFNPGYRYLQDTDLWMRALGSVKVGCIHKPLTSNLQHPGILGAEYMEPKTKEQAWNRKVFEKEKEMVAKHARMFGDHPEICAMVCMKNEEKNIDRCLNDVIQWADSVVVFNDGSTDRSPEIARSYPKVVEVFDSPPKGNIRTEGDDRQKLLEIAVAQNPRWILFYDCDERFENLMKWIVYDLINDDTKNLYYAHQVNLWRDLTHYRADEMWAKGWFPRLFRNTPGLKMQDEEEHCGGVPYNIPGATMFPSDNSPKGQCIEAQVIHYSFVEWADTLKKYMGLMERDPEHIDKKGIRRGGAEYYDRIIDEQGLVLAEYEGDSVEAHMLRGEI